jgi:hypothetical protein
MEIIKAGTKIVIGMNAGMCGTDQMNAHILSRDYTSEELENIAWQAGLDHAAMYSVYPTCDMPDDYDEEENDGDEYNDNIEGWWELYDEEKHEGSCSYGRGVDFHSI